MKEIAAYLTFSGNCRDAMQFYAECLGAELQMTPFSKAPMKIPEGAKNLIVHARLAKGDAVLMASDAMPGMQVHNGNNFWVAIKCESVEETDKLFAAFSDGAKVVMQPQETFWATRFGMLTDRFGVNWMFNFEKAGLQRLKNQKTPIIENFDRALQTRENWPSVQAVHSTTCEAGSVDLRVRGAKVGGSLPGGFMVWKWPSASSNNGTTEEWTGFIDQGVTLEGTLQLTGTFRINGNVKGNIISEQTVILGEGAKVEGQIEGNRVVIAGRFDGVIFAKGRVEIQAKGVVTGEVHSPCMVVDPGGIFDGRCHMLASSDATSGVTIPIRALGRAQRKL